MKWPWRRGSEDDEALAEAENRLEAVKRQRPRVEEAAERMRVHKRRNHFAESIATIYRSGS